MSRDIRIWTRASLKEAVVALRADGFRGEGLLSSEGKGWAMTASVDRVEPEDIPIAVIEEMRGIGTLVNLTLSPVGAADPAHVRQDRLAKRLARELEGAVEDCQTGAVWVSPAHRLNTALKSARPMGETELTLLEFGWWFDHDRFATPEGLMELLEALERCLPEALPRRYGEWEPPQFKRAEHGLRPFAEMSMGTLGAVAYPTPPVLSFHVSPARDVGLIKVGGRERYSARYLSIGVDRAALGILGYAAHLAHVFRGISRFVSPYYGEVRPVGGYIRSGARAMIGRNTEAQPVEGPWWRGLPDGPVIARVVGPEYRLVWPASERWEAAGELRMQMQQDWSAPPALADVPHDLAQPAYDIMDDPLNSGPKRAEVFPLL